MALGGHNYPSGNGMKQTLLTKVAMIRVNKGWTLAEAVEEKETLRRKTVEEIRVFYKSLLVA